MIPSGVGRKPAESLLSSQMVVTVRVLMSSEACESRRTERTAEKVTKKVVKNTTLSATREIILLFSVDFFKLYLLFVMVNIIAKISINKILDFQTEMGYAWGSIKEV